MGAKVDWVARARLASGVVLFVFVATHLLNHALGTISLDAMESGRKVFLAVWRNPAGTIILFVSLLIHFGLVLYSLFRRRTLRMPVREALQIIAGLAIPPLLIVHVIGTWGLNQFFEVDDLYAYVVWAIWVAEPVEGVKQTAALLIAWFHGCIGLHYWLKLKPWYPRVGGTLFALALLWPAFALSGFATAGREVAILVSDQEGLEALLAPVGLPGEAGRGWALAAIRNSYWGLAVILVAVLALRWVRLVMRRASELTLTYPDGRTLTVRRGTSILEASRDAGIPHASVCGGRGRCSTCRVRVGNGKEELPPPGEDEARVLKRVGAAANVRLACQVRPTHNVTVTPLLPATAQASDGHARPAYIEGSEREIAIMFVDIRAFTQMAEKKLPYDTVFLLNQYFRTMGTAVEDAGGQLDKFIGDGVMALFGIEGEARDGCRDALIAARAMAASLKDLNANLKEDLDEAIRIGIGIHVGPVIVGEMGYRAVRSVTAVGDTVNTASRLETANKDFHSQLVVSAEVVERAAVDLSAFPRHEIEVRGRDEKVTVHVLDDASKLPELAVSKAA